VDIKEKAKALGLKHAENMLMDLVDEIMMPVAEIKIKESPNKIDDILLPYIEDVKAAIKGVVDQIDPNDNKPEEPKA